MKHLSLGEKIKARRKELGLTAEKLAEKAKIDRTYLSKIERHNFLPSLDVLTKIIIHLKVSPFEYVQAYQALKYPGASVLLRTALQSLSKGGTEEWCLYMSSVFISDYKRRIAKASSPEQKKKYERILKKHNKSILDFFAKIMELYKEVEPTRAKLLELQYLSKKTKS